MTLQANCDQRPELFLFEPDWGSCEALARIIFWVPNVVDLDCASLAATFAPSICPLHDELAFCEPSWALHVFVVGLAPLPFLFSFSFLALLFFTVLFGCTPGIILSSVN